MAPSDERGSHGVLAVWIAAGNIRYVKLGTKFRQDFRRGRAERFQLLARFGLAEETHEYPARISGGQNQRAAIVRALMDDPEILLLDEVTSALDPELVGEVLSVIRDLAEQGLTMVLATHEMGFARDVANTVSFLNQGKVLESGPPNELFSAPQESAHVSSWPG